MSTHIQTDSAFPGDFDLELAGIEIPDVIRQFLYAEHEYSKDGIQTTAGMQAVVDVYHRARRLMLHMAADQGYLDDHLQDAEYRLTQWFPEPGLRKGEGSAESR